MEVLKSSYTYTMIGSFLSYRNVPLTVIKMLHITLTSFHINVYANKSYVIGADPSPKTLSTPPQIQNPGKYTVPNPSLVLAQFLLLKM